MLKTLRPPAKDFLKKKWLERLGLSKDPNLTVEVRDTEIAIRHEEERIDPMNLSLLEYLSLPAGCLRYLALNPDEPIGLDDELEDIYNEVVD